MIPTRRFEILHDAEDLFLSEPPVVLVYWYTNTYLLQPSVQNWNPLVLGNHNYKYIDLKAERELSQMIKIIVGRLLQLIPVLWIILTLTFFMSKMVPGGPFSAERQATPEVIARLNAYYGLDKPLWEQYLGYLAKFVRFDLGPSYTYQSESVNEVIARSFPISLQIGTLAFCIASVLGITAGVIAAANKNKLWDYFPMSLSMLGICLPTFVLGPVLALALWPGSEACAGQWLAWTELCAVPSDDHAGSDAWAVLCRLHRPLNSRRDAGYSESGFYPDRSRQGSSGSRDHSQTCSPRRITPGRGVSRSGVCRTSQRFLRRGKGF